MNMDPMEIEPAAMAWLSSQPWPGNVRELLNMVRRLVVFSNGGPIDSALIRLMGGHGDPAADMVSSDEPVPYKIAKKQALDIFSRTYLTRLFEHTRGNISETARISGLERASIQKIIRRLDMDISRFRS
jgi:DNA-binding NtrC family response regulator